MRTKNLLFTVLAILFAANALALDHGSLIVKDTLYEQRDGLPVSLLQDRL